MLGIGVPRQVWSMLASRSAWINTKVVRLLLQSLSYLSYKKGNPQEGQNPCMGRKTLTSSENLSVGTTGEWGSTPLHTDSP